MKKLTTVAVLAILTASSVSAEGFYVGAGISQERVKEPCGDTCKSTNAIASIGYDINDLIAVEAETSLPVSKTSDDGIDLSVKHTAVHLKFTLPTSGSFKPFARAGMMKGIFEAKESSNVVSNVNDTVFSYGIGAEWALSEKFGLRVDYSMIEIEGANGEVIALSSVYRF